MSQTELDSFVSSTVPDVLREYYIFSHIDSESEKITILGIELNMNDALAIFNDAYHYHNVRKVLRAFP